MPNDLFNLSGDDAMLGLDEVLGLDEMSGVDEMAGDDAMLGAAVRKAKAKRQAVNAVVQAAARAARTGAGLQATGVQILPFSSSAAIAASATAVVTGTPQRPFRAERLTVDEETGTNFRMNSFDIGADPQFVAPGIAPAQAFQYNAVGIKLKGSIAVPGILITASVTNKDAANAHFFSGLIAGPSNDQ